MHKKRGKLYFAVVAFLGMAAWSWPVAAIESPLDIIKDVVYNFQDKTEFHGFLQQGVSYNLEDPEETERNDVYDASMIRSTLYGDVRTAFDWYAFTCRFRYDLEYETDYVSRLQDLREAGGARDDLVKDNYNNWDFREWFGDFEFADRFFLRLGKQQIVWGKTDFFSGLDIIHGYDNTWRSFLEGENEHRRKPLIIANLTTQVPELNGSLQTWIRPGWDRSSDIGNEYDLFGGRWSQQPNKGFDFLAPGAMKYNLDHNHGDVDDPTYGIRWSGIAGPVEYTLNYLHSFNPDPVVNPSEATFGALGAKNWHEEPEGTLGDFIYPQIDIAGITANYYVYPLDIIVRTEILYEWNVPYNYGRDFAGGALPGFAGITERDTVRSMLAFDRNVDFPMWMLGSQRPGFLNI